MGNVYSITGRAYVLPSLQDRRTAPVEFDIALTSGARRATVGFTAPFGLVLHRAAADESTSRRRSPLAEVWTISEPRTGYRVVGGRTRQQALDALAERVAYEGGPEAFELAVQAAVAAASAACSPSSTAPGEAARHPGSSTAEQAHEQAREAIAPEHEDRRSCDRDPQAQKFKTETARARRKRRLATAFQPTTREPSTSLR